MSFSILQYASIHNMIHNLICIPLNSILKGYFFTKYKNKGRNKQGKMDFDNPLHESAVQMAGNFVSKDFLSQKADKIYFMFNKCYLCKLEPIFLWKKKKSFFFFKED